MRNLIMLIIAVNVLFACKSDIKSENKTDSISNENTVSLTNAQFKNAKIETSILQQKTIASVLKLNGKIDVPPQNIISISAPLGGYLKNTKLLRHKKELENQIVLTNRQQLDQ